MRHRINIALQATVNGERVETPNYPSRYCIHSNNTSTLSAVAVKTNDTTWPFVLDFDTEFERALNYSCNCAANDYIYVMITTPSGHVFGKTDKEIRDVSSNRPPNGLPIQPRFRFFVML